MFNLSNLTTEIAQGLISLPVILLAISVHEMAHGYAAYWLGDPTARNLGRLSLNPLRHIDPVGFLCMFLFHFGWAKPVPINSRNFKNPRRDMALTGLAGPVSNLLQAVIYAALLRLLLFFVNHFCSKDITSFYYGVATESAYTVSGAFVVLAILSVMVYMGVIVNFGYAIFNLIPIPPLDGSRIFYVFLPTRLYFGIMKYERIIAIVMLVGLWFGILTTPLTFLVSGLQNGIFWLFGIRSGSAAYEAYTAVLYYIYSFIG